MTAPERLFFLTTDATVTSKESFVYYGVQVNLNVRRYQGHNFVKFFCTFPVYITQAFYNRMALACF